MLDLPLIDPDAPVDLDSNSIDVAKSPAVLHLVWFSNEIGKSVDEQARLVSNPLASHELGQHSLGEAHRCISSATCSCSSDSN